MLFRRSFNAFKANPVGYLLGVAIASFFGTLSFALTLGLVLVALGVAAAMGPAWPVWAWALPLMGMPLGAWLEMEAVRH